jgi:outer membrane protein assembly factor BamC
VEDRNQAQGVYHVRYQDPYADQGEEGLLSKMAFWKDSKKIEQNSQYQVRLQPQGGSTEVGVFTQSGQRDNSQTAVRILTLLHEQIR